MLQKLHEKIKGWVAGVIIAIISATFVLWGVQYYLQSSGNEQVVAKVNGEKITLKQLTAQTQQLQRQYLMKTGQVLSDEQSTALRQYALDNLILNRLLLKAAQQAGLRVSAELVNTVIVSMPQFQENGQFSPSRYQQLLYANGLTPAAFMQQLTDEILIQQMAKGIQETTFILPSELQRDAQLIHQQRSFGYVIVPQARFINSAKPTEKMLADYYQQHRDEFKAPEKVSVEYLKISPEDIARSVQVTAAEVTRYYQDNRARYQAQKKTLATANHEIKKLLLQQKINAILAKQSDQLSSLAYTNPTTLKPAATALHMPLQTSILFTQQGTPTGLSADPKIVTVAFSNEVLTQGNNSDPIELKDGSMVILRIKEHQPARLLSLTEVTAQIKTILQKQMAQARAAVVAADIASLINQHQLPAQAAQRYQLLWQEVKNITRDNRLISPTLVSAVFSLEKAQAVTTVVLPNNDSAVLQLRAIHSVDSRKLSPQHTLSAQLATALGDIEYQLYVYRTKIHAKIKIMSVAKTIPN